MEENSRMKVIMAL